MLCYTQGIANTINDIWEWGTTSTKLKANRSAHCYIYVSGADCAASCTTSYLRWSKHTLLPCVADDFGYCMPGQRQKRVSWMSLIVPSTTWRQVTRNALNNSGDGALTVVPLCRGLSGTEFTLGGRWKSRGQVGQTMDVTGGFIYYLCLPDDSP